MARLKLAKAMWKNEETREINTQEILHIIERIIESNQENTTLLVKTAAL